MAFYFPPSSIFLIFSTFNVNITNERTISGSFFTETQEQHDTQPAQHDTIVPETQQPTSTSTTTKVRAKTSLVWNHFVEKVVEGRRKAECKYCHQLFDHKEGYGTGVLNKHYEKKAC